MAGPRFFYLHGFASGPDSTKAVALARHYEGLGVGMDRLNLRVPSVERLRLSEMIRTVGRAVGGEGDRAVLFGSSMGGLAAARLAEQDPRILALVLMAPAFGFVDAWRRRLGPEGWEKWRREGLEVHDYARKTMVRVDFGFIEDAEAVERRGPPDVRVPTLIIHGRRDETVDVAVSREWARGKPHVRLVETDDGHELKASVPLILSEADGFLSSFLRRRREHGAVGGLD
jgi:pimeloyl-ACP methyl ester carboxylesterase